MAKPTAHGPIWITRCLVPQSTIPFMTNIIFKGEVSGEPRTVQAIKAAVITVIVFN